jgi:hypothetical protein
MATEAEHQLDKQIFAYRTVRAKMGPDMALTALAHILNAPPYDAPGEQLSMLLVAIDRLAGPVEDYR